MQYPLCRWRMAWTAVAKPSSFILAEKETFSCEITASTGLDGQGPSEQAEMTNIGALMIRIGVLGHIIL